MLARVLLGLGVLVSFVSCLYIGRGTIFSGDELAWVSASPDLDLERALTPHSGHLVLSMHLLYKASLEIFGMSYFPFRVGALLSVYFLAIGVYAYARTVVNEYIALAPCLILLVFGSDFTHVLQGNGITIAFATGCGVWALYLMRSHRTSRDALACILLCLGVVTYSTVLAFLVGAIAVALIPERKWHRLWVSAIPIAIYLGWRVWLLTSSIAIPRGDISLSYVLLLPNWTFQSAGAALSAILGLNFDFNTNGLVDPGVGTLSAFSLVFFGFIGMRLRAGDTSRWFWICTITLVALLLSQVVTYIPEIRTPGNSRYLLPLTVTVLLVVAEAARGLRLDRYAIIVVWVLGLTGLAGNATLLWVYGGGLRDRAAAIAKGATVRDIVSSGTIPTAERVAYEPRLAETTGIPGSISHAEDRYGQIGYRGDEIRTLSESMRADLDKTLAVSIYDLTLQSPTDGAAVKCTNRSADIDGRVTVMLSTGRTIFTSKDGSFDLKLGRFADTPTVNVGRLEENQAAELTIPADGAQEAWYAQIEGGLLRVCSAS